VLGFSWDISGYSDLHLSIHVILRCELNDKLWIDVCN